MTLTHKHQCHLLLVSSFVLHFTIRVFWGFPGWLTSVYVLHLWQFLCDWFHDRYRSTPIWFCCGIYGIIIFCQNENTSASYFMISSQGKDTVLLSKTNIFQIGVVIPEIWFFKVDAKFCLHYHSSLMFVVSMKAFKLKLPYFLNEKADFENLLFILQIYIYAYQIYKFDFKMAGSNRVSFQNSVPHF